MKIDGTFDDSNYDLKSQVNKTRASSRVARLANKSAQISDSSGILQQLANQHKIEDILSEFTDLVSDLNDDRDLKSEIMEALKESSSSEEELSASIADLNSFLTSDYRKTLELYNSHSEALDNTDLDEIQREITRFTKLITPSAEIVRSSKFNEFVNESQNLKNDSETDIEVAKAENREKAKQEARQSVSNQVAKVGSEASINATGQLLLGADSMDQLDDMLGVSQKLEALNEKKRQKLESIRELKNEAKLEEVRRLTRLKYAKEDLALDDDAQKDRDKKLAEDIADETKKVESKTGFISGLLGPMLANIMSPSGLALVGIAASIKVMSDAIKSFIDGKSDSNDAEARRREKALAPIKNAKNLTGLDRIEALESNRQSILNEKLMNQDTPFFSGFGDAGWGSIGVGDMANRAEKRTDVSRKTSREVAQFLQSQSTENQKNLVKSSVDKVMSSGDFNTDTHTSEELSRQILQSLNQLVQQGKINNKYTESISANTKVVPPQQVASPQSSGKK